MRMFFLLVIAAILAVAPPDAKAGPATPESMLLNGAQIVANARVYQKEHCKQPRNNTTQQCVADFERFAEAMTEAAARHILFLIAKKKGQKETSRLERESDQTRAIVQRLSKDLDRLYMPQPTAPIGQAPAPKPVSLNTK